MTSIATERKLYARVGFTHRRREQWGARFDYTTARAVEEPATRLFIHITVTNPDAYASADAHARAVESIGILRFPSTGISYNELVMPGGKLYEAQPMGRRGAHTINDYHRSTCTLSGCPSKGYPLTAPDWNLNLNSRALAFARNTDDRITDLDVDAAARWCAAGKLAGMVAKNARMHGHRCVAAKSCPGDTAWARMDDIRDLTADYLRQGDVMSATGPEHWDSADWAAFNARAGWGRDIRNLVSGGKNDASTLLSYTHKHAYDAKRGVAILLGRDPADVDEAALAQLLAPLLTTRVSSLSAEALAAVAKAVNDELARRQQA